MTEIVAYLDLTHVSREADIDLFFRCMMLLDAAWIDNYYKDKEAKEASNRRKSRV